MNPRRFVVWIALLFSVISHGEEHWKKEYTNIEFTLDEEFTESERRIITDSVELVARRINSKRVKDCFNKSLQAAEAKLGKGQAVMLARDYLPLVAEGFPWNPSRYPSPGLQLFYMKDYLENTLPHLQINRTSQDGSLRGYVEGSHFVHIPYGAKSEDDINGEFEIYLNGKQIGLQKSRLLSESDVWAGVIWHEMLHNLGHLHPVDDYRPHTEIVLYQRCVAHNGKFKFEGEGGVPDVEMVCGKHHLKKK